MNHIEHWFMPPVSLGDDFLINGIGMRERAIPCLVDRPAGTPDYGIMFFLDESHIRLSETIGIYPPFTLIIWEPDHPQCFGNNHKKWTISYLHCMGDFVPLTIKSAGIKCNEPLTLPNAVLVERYLIQLHGELTSHVMQNSIIVKNLFENWLHEISRLLRPDELCSMIPQKYVEIRRFMETHYSDHLSLQDLAHRMNLSGPYFVNEFKKHFDMPPMKFLFQLRMQHAAHHLKNFNHNVSEVARLVGYHDLFQFSRMFKKFFGISPTVMRRHMIEDLQQRRA